MKQQTKKRNVAIYQRIIPHYRVALFNSLAKQKELDVRVFASKTIDGFQASTDQAFQFNFSPVSGFSLGSGLYFQFGARIPRNFEKGDVVVLAGMPKFLNLYELMIAAKTRDIGVLWWGHGFSTKNRRWSVHIRQKIMKLSDALLLYTDREAEQYIKKGFRPDRVFAINNTINTHAVNSEKERWTDQQLRRFQKREKILNKKNILFSGRLIRKAKLNIAIESLASLIRIDPDYRLIVIGDGAEKESLLSTAERLEVSHAIKWVGSVYDEAKLAPWFLSSSVFVFPGNIGLSLIHAFAFGLPVITHNIPALHGPEFAALREGENGLLYDYGDHSDFAEKVRILATDSQKAKSMGLFALHTVHDEYSFEGMVRRFTDAILTTSAIKLNG